MNSKIINQVLCRKFNAWASSITDNNVKNLVLCNSIITGGCITSMLLREPVNDYDVYFTNRETVLAVANYYANQLSTKMPSYKISVNESMDGRITVDIKSVGEVAVSGFERTADDESIESEELRTEVDSVLGVSDDSPQPAKDLPKFRPVYATSNAITLSDKVQIILRFYGNVNEIHKNYDFIHCTNFWTSSDKKLYLNQAALESILTKQLRYCGSLYPLASVIRTRKFIKRGWHINAGQYIKMCYQISKLDLNDIEVLKDQLTGVDNAFFERVIANIAEEKKNKPGFELDNSYLCNLIDKIF